MDEQSRTKSGGRAMHPLLYLVPLVGMCMPLLGLLAMTGRGYDLSDEGFYLNSIADPFRYPASAMLFGFFHHPLYLACGGDIALMRSINVVLTMVLGWVVTHGLLRSMFDRELPEGWQGWAVSGGIASASLAVFNRGLITPNYNVLAFQGIMLLLLGLVHVRRRDRAMSGWIWFGVAAWVLFMAKPTAMVATGLLVLLFLILTRRLWIAGAASSMCVAVVLFLSTALVIDGSVTGFLHRLISGAEELVLMDGRYGAGSLFRRFKPFVPDRRLAVEAVVLTLSLGVLTFMLMCWQARRLPVGRSLLWPVASCLLIFVLVVVALRTQRYGHPGMILLAFPFALLLSVPWREYRALPLHRLWLALLLFLLPLAFALGTNTDPWLLGMSAGVFWVIAGVATLPPPNRGARLLVVGSVVPVLAGVVVLVGMRTPYRQPGPLWSNGERVELGAPASSLLMHPVLATQIRSAMEAGRTHGMAEGTAVIDLTGRSPGLVYAMGGQSIILPWMIGGYPGSCQRTLAAVRRVPCAELASAWVIDEPEGPRRICSELIHAFGGDLDRDYEVVAEWDAPRFFKGKVSIWKQRLLRPVPSDAHLTSACQRSRNTTRFR